MDIKNTIHATKSGFEQSFKEGSLYNKQTQDQEHLHKILEAIQVKPNQTILDLGTGSGYLAFAIAKANPEAKVIGLDIVEETLQRNREIAKEEGIENLSFVSYDGIDFPFDQDIFDTIVTRYSLHHFPDIKTTFSNLFQILKKDGHFFLSDPTPNENDEERFVDAYMKMKKDGHIKYYTKQEFTELAQNAGMQLVDSFETSITFPRLRETALEFDDIMKTYSSHIIEGYQVHMTEDNLYIYITQRVLNLKFEKE